MAKDDPSLLAAFDQAYDYFNKHDFTDTSWAKTMDPLLDVNVKMKKLDDPGQYHQGRDDVKKYFLKGGHGFADQATFRLRTRDCEVIGDLGFISGFAEFVDQDGTNRPPSPSRLIAYSFTYHKESGSWKAIHLWGAYLQFDKICK